MSRLSRRLKHAGLKDGKLRRCGRYLNCVSSADSRPYFSVDPLTATLEDARSAVEKMGGHVMSESPGYFHAEFRSALWGFVDDLDCQALEPGSIQIRSRSRRALFDFFANKRRVARLRAHLSAK